MGFYSKLDSYIKRSVNESVPMKSRSHMTKDQYLRRLHQVTCDILLKTDFLSLWESVDWLRKPTEEDKSELNDAFQDLPKLQNYDLYNVYLCLIQSITQIIKAGKETSDKAKWLHLFYLWAQKAVKSRNDPSCETLKFDFFEEALAEVKKFGITEKNTEEYRVTGSHCIFCNSKNVHSYNASEWKCYTCGKRFRKH